MPSHATRGALRPRASGARLAAALAGAVAFAAVAQTYRIPDLKPPPPRIAPAPRPGEPCNGCGRIAAIREVSTEGRLPGAAVAPVPGGGGQTDITQQNLMGAVIYLPLGGDKAADRPYIGGVGTPEMAARLRTTTYEIVVRLDDGNLRIVRRPDGAAFGVGDRVRWYGGDELELIAN
jgi:outer membrane lipoprotein SlyB